MIAWLLSLLCDPAPRAADLTGATDGYGQHWSGCAQVTPDFTRMKP